MYSEVLIQHAKEPKNRETLPSCNASGSAYYEACSDKLQLSLHIQDSCVLKACFQAQACGPVIALASIVTEEIRGKHISEIRGMDAFYWDRLAGGLPPAKRHAILLILDCLAQATSTVDNT